MKIFRYSKVPFHSFYSSKFHSMQTNKHHGTKRNLKKIVHLGKIGTFGDPRSGSAGRVLKLLKIGNIWQH